MHDSIILPLLLLFFIIIVSIYFFTCTPEILDACHEMWDGWDGRVGIGLEGHGVFPYLLVLLSFSLFYTTASLLAYAALLCFCSFRYCCSGYQRVYSHGGGR